MDIVPSRRLLFGRSHQNSFVGLDIHGENLRGGQDEGRIQRQRKWNREREEEDWVPTMKIL